VYLKRKKDLRGEGERFKRGTWAWTPANSSLAASPLGEGEFPAGGGERKPPGKWSEEAGKVDQVRCEQIDSPGRRIRGGPTGIVSCREETGGTSTHLPSPAGREEIGGGERIARRG